MQDATGHSGSAWQEHTDTLHALCSPSKGGRLGHLKECEVLTKAHAKGFAQWASGSVTGSQSPSKELLIASPLGMDTSNNLARPATTKHILILLLDNWMTAEILSLLASLPAHQGEGEV